MKNEDKPKKPSNFDLNNLNKPIFVLAPMDDVTDTVFRQVVAGTAAPDLYFTEFVNVDALQSKGREATLPRLKLTDTEHPIIAQVWGLNPENFYKSARDIQEMGFDGVDINFGCPDKNVVRNGACSAFILPDNREKAIEIIEATREGAGPLPLSVKTRLGFNEIDYSWHEELLKLKLNMLTIHGRTKRQMSDVPADWDKIGHIRELRDSLSPSTLIVGNGDVLTRSQGVELAEKYKVDGIMIGRGIFQDPYVFAENSPWEDFNKEQKIGLYRKHVELFRQTYEVSPPSRTYGDAAQGSQEERANRTDVTVSERQTPADTALRPKQTHDAGSARIEKSALRSPKALNKFCKVYINGFDGAKELREQLMAAKSTDQLLDLLSA